MSVKLRGSASVSETVTYEYNGNGQMTRRKLNDGNVNRIQDNTYNAAGWVTEVANKGPAYMGGG